MARSASEPDMTDHAPGSGAERRLPSDTIRAALRPVRHLPDRVLHGLRRRRALDAIKRLGSPASVLMICHGNICRSPYAAGALQRDIDPGGGVGILVDSAGFIGPGRRSPDVARAIAKRRGVDMDGHVSKTLSGEIVTASDLIIVMDSQQRRAIRDQFEPRGAPVIVLGDLDPGPIRRRTILDPINQPEEVFEAVYERIDGCVRVLGKALGT